MKWFMIFLITGNLLAHDDIHEIECPPTGQSDLAQKLLDRFSSDELDVKNAPCKTKRVPSFEQMKKFIDQKAKDTWTATVHGVKLQDESPALITAFRDFTTAMDKWGILAVKNEQKNIKTTFSIGPECKKALCAMEKIWGKEMAMKMLYVKLKHNFNVSELAFQNSDRLNIDELDDIIIGLEDLPPSLIPVGNKNQPLTHYARGDTLDLYKDKRVTANAIIMLFDLWSKEPSLNRQYAIFHELSHNIGSKMNEMAQSPEWLKLSGWIKKGDDWELPGSACFVSEYGLENPWEDYAESLSAYRYNGREFKRKCPEKYNHLKKNVFKGLEYTDEKSCKLSVP